MHPIVGLNRVDSCGALILSRGSRVVSVTAEAITFENRLVYRRKPWAEKGWPIWELP